MRASPPSPESADGHHVTSWTLLRQKKSDNRIRCECLKSRCGTTDGYRHLNSPSKKRKPPLLAAPIEPVSHMEMLLKLGRNAGELGVQGGTNRIDCRYDHDRNSGGNQTVFNGRGTRLIPKKCKHARHVTTSLLLRCSTLARCRLKDPCIAIGESPARCQDFPDSN